MSCNTGVAHGSLGLDTYTKKMNPPLAVLGGGVHGKVCWLMAYCHQIIHVHFTRCFTHVLVIMLQKFPNLTILQRFQNKN